ncbi:MAG: glycosyltransferase family 39 protein [Candidatus Sumerlaeia bacterium]
MLIAVAVCLLLAGVWLRLYHLGLESFWLDEVFSANIVEGPPGQILDRIPHDKPPLDYYIQAMADRLPVPREVSHRLSAAISGVLALLLLWGFARRLYGEKIAWAAVALAAVHASFIHYSREARPYSNVNLMLIGQMWVFYALWERLRAGAALKSLVGPIALLVALSTLAVYTSYGTVLILMTEFLFLLGALPVLERRRPDWSGWGRPIAMFAALALILAAATLPLRGHVDVRPPEDYFWRFQGFHATTTARWLAELLIGLTPVNAWAWASAIPLTALVAIGAVRAWRLQPRATLFVALCSIALPALAVVFYAVIDREFTTRYTIFSSVGLCMLMAHGALAVAGRLRRPWVAGAVILAFAAGALALHAADRFEKCDWRGAARYLRERVRPGERIVVTSYQALVPQEYYLSHEGVAAPCMLPGVADKLPEAPYWRVDQVYGHAAKAAATVQGVRIEPLGQAPGPERLGELAAALGNPPTLRPGAGPAALLGAGWSEPEHWSKDFSVRWLCRPCSWFNLPITAPGAGRLSIKLMPAKWPQGPPQWIQPRIGTTTLERRTLPAGFSTQAWDVPAGVLARGYNRIELEIAWLHSPSEDSPGYGDFRRLGAAVESIAWTPAR